MIAPISPLFQGASTAIRAGDLLFISGLMAVRDGAMVPEAKPDPAQPFWATPVKAELREILRQADAICLSRRHEPQERGPHPAIPRRLNGPAGGAGGLVGGAEGRADATLARGGELAAGAGRAASGRPLGPRPITLSTNRVREDAMKTRLWLAAAAACVALAVSALPSSAQQWPSRNVRVVVPYGVGGVTDTMARLTADRLSKMLGQTFVIENKVGAGGAIGIDYALSFPRDGYTILFVGSTLFTVLPLAQKVNYEPLKDLVPLSITGTNGMVMVVPKESPHSTLKEFLDYAKANPGKITYSSGGPATNNHLSTAYLAGKLGLDMVHVPFGGGQAGAHGGAVKYRVDMHFGNSSDLIEPSRNGPVKALAVSTKERMPQLPECADGGRDGARLRVRGVERLCRAGRHPGRGCYAAGRAAQERSRRTRRSSRYSRISASTRSAPRRRRRWPASARTCRSMREIVDQAGVRKK